MLTLHMQKFCKSDQALFWAGCGDEAMYRAVGLLEALGLGLGIMSLIIIVPRVGWMLSSYFLVLRMAMCLANLVGKWSGLE